MICHLTQIQKRSITMIINVQQSLSNKNIHKISTKYHIDWNYSLGSRSEKAYDHIEKAQPCSIQKSSQKLVIRGVLTMWHTLGNQKFLNIHMFKRINPRETFLTHNPFGYTPVWKGLLPLERCCEDGHLIFCFSYP